MKGSGFSMKGKAFSMKGRGFSMKGRGFSMKGTGFSPYIRSCFWSPALAAEGMQTPKNFPSGVKFVAEKVRAEGAGGFNPRIESTESTRASAPDGPASSK
jgi:hypothetical protein